MDPILNILNQAFVWYLGPEKLPNDTVQLRALSSCQALICFRVHHIKLHSWQRCRFWSNEPEPPMSAASSLKPCCGEMKVVSIFRNDATWHPTGQPAVFQILTRWGGKLWFIWDRTIIVIQLFIEKMGFKTTNNIWGAGALYPNVLLQSVLGMGWKWFLTLRSQRSPASSPA